MDVSHRGSLCVGLTYVVRSIDLGGASQSNNTGHLPGDLDHEAVSVTIGGSLENASWTTFPSITDTAGTTIDPSQLTTSDESNEMTNHPGAGTTV
jgi:hypothetical protein